MVAPDELLQRTNLHENAFTYPADGELFGRNECVEGSDAESQHFRRFTFGDEKWGMLGTFPSAPRFPLRWMLFIHAATLNRVQHGAGITISGLAADFCEPSLATAPTIGMRIGQTQPCNVC